MTETIVGEKRLNIIKKLCIEKSFALCIVA